MENKKSDLRRFCETMWIMVRYSVLPWMVGAGIAAAALIGVTDMAKKQKIKSEINKTSVFEKQR
jgi:hypothetical protein